MASIGASDVILAKEFISEFGIENPSDDQVTQLMGLNNGKLVSIDQIKAQKKN